ncbi:MAG: TIR domain-containing protein [Pseudomonadota bacterium]
MEQPYRYRAFISYSHADEAWAKWLHRALETYRVPSRLRRGARSELPKKLSPIFRDRDELPSATELGSVIQQALRESQDLIVICSPRAAASRWVNEEIRYFKSLGHGGRVLALIVDGEPHAADVAQECFPLALRFSLTAEGHKVQAVEPIAADARAGRDGRAAALLKLIAGLLGVGFDDLAQRERQRQFWQRVQQAAAAIAGIALLLSAWQWFEHYKRQQALDQRIENVYERGRLALLEQSPARAAVYLGEAYQLGLDTPALRFMLARAMETVNAIHRLPLAAEGFIQRPIFSPDDQHFITPVVGEGGTVAVVRDAQSGAEQQRLKGLPAYPQLLRYLPDGKRVLSSGYAQSSNYAQQGAETVLWDVQSGRELLRVRGHGGHFGNPLSPDARLLLTAEGEPGGVQLRDATTGAVVRQLPHEDSALAASFSADGRSVFTGDAAGVVRQWDATSGRLLQTLPGRTATGITGVLASPDGRRVIAASRKGDLRVWGLPAGELLLAFSADKSYVSDLKLDAAGLRLLSVGRQGYKVWDLERGVLLFARDIKLDWAASGDLDASGRFVAIATTDSPRAELWDVLSRRRIADLEFEPQAVSAAVFNQRGTALLLAGETGNTAVIAPLPGPRLDLRQPPALYGAQFAGATARIVTAGFDQQLGVWDRSSGSRRASGLGHTQRLVQVVTTRDGERALTAADDGSVKVWRVADGTLLASVAVAGATRRLLLSPDDEQLLLLHYAATAEDNQALLLDAATAQTVQVMQHPARVLTAVFSPDGSSLWTGGEDGVLRQWSRGDGQLLRTHALGKLRFTALRFGRDPQRLLVVDQVSGAQVVDVSNGAILSRLLLPEGTEPNSVGGVAVAPDGRHWALLTNGGEIWSQPVAGGSWRVIPQRGQRPWELRYLSPSLLVSSDWDGALHVWDSTRAEPIGLLGAHDQVAWTMDLDASATQLLSASLDGSARVWNVGGELPEPSALRQAVECRVPLKLDDALQLQRMAAPDCR